MANDDPIEIELPEPALELWLQDGQPAVITCRSSGCTEWALRWRDGDGEWSVKTKIATKGDKFVAISSAGAAITVLTRQGIVEVVGDKQSEVALSGSLSPRAIATTHVTPTSIFVGFNSGEWGGGLRRIDRSTGRRASRAQRIWGTLWRATKYGMRSRQRRYYVTLEPELRCSRGWTGPLSAARAHC